MGPECVTSEAKLDRLPTRFTLSKYGPGSRVIQLQLQATCFTNVARYPEWHAYFREHQPKMLVVWGKGDQIFTVEGARAYARDVKTVDCEWFDTGHFALEEEHTAIAARIRRFFAERDVR